MKKSEVMTGGRYIYVLPCKGGGHSIATVKVQKRNKGYAVVTFESVLADNSGNGYLNWLLRTGGTMNVSYRYLEQWEFEQPTPLIHGEYLDNLVAHYGIKRQQGENDAELAYRTREKIAEVTEAKEWAERRGDRSIMKRYRNEEKISYIDIRKAWDAGTDLVESIEWKEKMKLLERLADAMEYGKTYCVVLEKSVTEDGLTKTLLLDLSFQKTEG